MVCAFGAALAVAGLIYPLVRGNRRHALGDAAGAARWSMVAVLAASGLQLAAAPRADQPLIDLAEWTAPWLRSLYFTGAELATFTEADQFAARYLAEAEQVNGLEKRSRTEGEALDDFAVARVSSFLKSYGEMRKGEQFVMAEVRARARQRVRWRLGLGLLAAALVLAPVPWRRLWARSQP
jgi:zinc/manganese transport system permease protein